MNRVERILMSVRKVKMVVISTFPVSKIVMKDEFSVVKRPVFNLVVRILHRHYDNLSDFKDIVNKIWKFFLRVQIGKKCFFFNQLKLLSDICLIRLQSTAPCYFNFFQCVLSEIMRLYFRTRIKV